MSNVWICIPSIRPGGGTLPEWKKRGYRVAVLRQGEHLPYADIEIKTDRYLGWAPSINILVRGVMLQDPDAQWMVGGGDDTLPDPGQSADDTARECKYHFGGTFGVMQPIGDLKDWPESWINNFAGSPWMGRQWCERAYEGQGPLFGGYFHNWADQELQEVAINCGVFWQRPDLTHRHEHWARHGSDRPAFADYINVAEYHDSKPLFDQRKAAGFPGSAPLMMATA